MVGEGKSTAGLVCGIVDVEGSGGMGVRIEGS